MLRPENVPLKKLFKMLTMRFVNVRSLKLDNLLKIENQDLVAPCTLSTLTILDVTWSIGFCLGSYMPRDVVRHGYAFLVHSECLKQTIFRYSWKYHKYGDTMFATLPFPHIIFI